MRNRPKVVPFEPSSPEEPEEAPAFYPVLGKLRRKDFELWVKRAEDGSLSLKWWRWREDLERFSPLEDGDLTLEPAELMPLAELLVSVATLLRRRGSL
jgi:hypothetical protein